MRTGLVIALLTLMAAPAAAQVTANANANVDVGGGGGGGRSLAPQGFLMGARLIVAEPVQSTVFDPGGGGFFFDYPMSMLPRYYLGYRFGKLGFLVGFNIASTSYDAERRGDDNEYTRFVFSVAPQILYEVTENGHVGLDIFAGPVIATGSESYDNSDNDAGIFGFGVDAGARIIGYVTEGLGIHADLGLHVAFVNREVDAAPNDSNEIDWATVGVYGAVGVLGTL